MADPWTTPTHCFFTVAVLVAMLSGCAATESAPPAAATQTPDCSFTGTTEPKEAPAGGDRFQLLGMHHDVIEPGCLERIVFRLDRASTGTDIGYSVFYRDAPFRGPSNELIEVAGEAVLEVVIHGAARHLQHAGEPVPASGAELVAGLAQPPEVPGGSIWLIGMTRQAPFSVSVEPGEELQLVVTVGVPGDLAP